MGLNTKEQEMVMSLDKQKIALDYVKAWLNENIDGECEDPIEEDSANLLQHIKEILEE